MAARKGSDGVWRYRLVVKLPDGSKERISGTPEVNTKVAALAEERLHIDRIKNPTTRQVSPLFSDFAETWLKKWTKAAGNRSSSYAEKEGHLRVHLVPFFGDKTRVTMAENGAKVHGPFCLHEITTSLIVDLLAHLSDCIVINRARKPDNTSRARSTRKASRIELGSLKRGNGKTLSKKTIRNIMQNLSKLLRCAKEWGHIKIMPDFPRIKVPKAKFDFYTEAESSKLLAACETPDERLEFQFALDTGARVSEQMAIEWRHVDWENRRIWIRQQIYKGELRAPKNGLERYVDMTSTLEAGLKDARSRRFRGAIPHGRIFAPPNARVRGESWTYSHFVGRMRRIRSRAGLRHLGWHGLRHSFASQLVMRGVPIAVIQKWMGHSTIIMTMRYAHLADGAGASYIRGLESRPGSGEREGGNVVPFEATDLTSGRG